MQHAAISDSHRARDETEPPWPADILSMPSNVAAAQGPCWWKGHRRWVAR